MKRFTDSDFSDVEEKNATYRMDIQGAPTEISEIKFVRVRKNETKL